MDRTPQNHDRFAIREEIRRSPPEIARMIRLSQFQQSSNRTGGSAPWKNVLRSSLRRVYNRFKAKDGLMSAHRSTLAQILISFTVCLLLYAVLSAEVPELMSLTDNASNDFTIHKTVNREIAKTLAASIHMHALRDADPFERTTWASLPPNTETPPSLLFPLHSVLRR
jgi:hypothetical protein